MTKVKICGLSTLEAVQTAVDSGADYIGFVFADSKRQVSVEQAKTLAKAISKPVQIVGVFVSPSLAELEQAIASVPLDMVQIHGAFSEKLLRQLNVPVIRAVPVSEDWQVSANGADFLLFDAPVAGSGKPFSWSQLNKEAVKHPFFIAGGLSTKNVKSAIRYFTPYAVDVSSGVETDGKKDIVKIKEFIESVKK